MNWGTPEIAEEAQRKILGADHAVPMIAFGTCKKKSAFKLYARSQNMNFDLANTISAQISKYDDAMKYASDEDRESISIYDFVDPQYHSYIDASKKYWGIIMDKKKAPCAFLLYSGSIREEIGLIKCKSESSGKEFITAVIDGAIAENYKFLKNDILTVSVVLLIDKIYNKIGIKHHTVNELMALVKDDQATWDIYKNGWTIGVNQCEQASSVKKMMKFKAHNVSELSAWIAAIRPAAKSIYDKFENREPFEYGIKAFDQLLQTKELPQSFILYQEQTMSVLNYAGFPLDECYGIIKAIAKKHPEKVRPLKSRFIDGFKQRIMNDDNIDEEKALDMSNQVWNIIENSCGYGFNCVSGSTRIVRGGRNQGFQPTVEEMYKIKNDKEYAKATGHYALWKKYNREGYGMALSLCEDNKLRPNKIMYIKESGISQTYEVKTKTGCSLVCTDNHKFPTPNGYMKLHDLKVGDQLYCMGEYKHKYFDTTLTDGNYDKNYPTKGQCGFQTNVNGASVKYDTELSKHRTNKDACEICGKQYSDKERFELHHRDMNRHNNEAENLQWLCCSCHKKIHYNNGRTKRYENGIETYLDEIVSIIPHDVEMVYDIEMDHPHHTFVSESGLVTSNSAHAYCMALDSLYGAYLKAHYPYEFYTTLLQFHSDRGEKDKVASLKREMSMAFNIKEGAYKFGLDNRRFIDDREHNSILPSLMSIKGFSQTCANDLYKLSHEHFDDFYSLLQRFQTVSSMNVAKRDILIKLDYFSDFGPSGTLLRIAEIFDMYNGTKIIKKNKAGGIPVDILEKYSKETAQQYKLTDPDGFVKALCALVPDIDLPLATKLSVQQEYLGYINYIDPTQKDVYVILDVNAKYSPKLTAYNLGTGVTETLKMYKKDYTANPIAVGWTAKIIVENKPKSQYIDGAWKKDYNTLEPWVKWFEIL